MTWLSAALVMPCGAVAGAGEAARGDPLERAWSHRRQVAFQSLHHVSVPEYINSLVLFTVVLRTLLGHRYVPVFALQMAGGGVLLTPPVSQGDLRSQFA